MVLVSVAVLILIIGLLIYGSRTDGTQGNGDNVTAARRYGGG